MKNFDETNPIEVYDMYTDKYGYPLKISTYSIHDNYGSKYNQKISDLDPNT